MTTQEIFDHYQEQRNQADERNRQINEDFENSKKQKGINPFVGGIVILVIGFIVVILINPVGHNIVNAVMAFTGK